MGNFISTMFLFFHSFHSFSYSEFEISELQLALQSCSKFDFTLMQLPMEPSDQILQLQEVQFHDLLVSSFLGRGVKRDFCKEKMSHWFLNSKIFSAIKPNGFGRDLLILRNDKWYVVELKFQFRDEFFDRDLYFFDMEVILKGASFTDSKLMEQLDQGANPSLILQQFQISRQNLIESGSPYGDALYDTFYLENDQTKWLYYKGKLSEAGSAFDIIYFSEFDDGSYSFYFQPNTTKLLWIAYEN